MLVLNKIDVKYFLPIQYCKKGTKIVGYKTEYFSTEEERTKWMNETEVELSENVKVVELSENVMTAELNKILLEAVKKSQPEQKMVRYQTAASRAVASLRK